MVILVNIIAAAFFVLLICGLTMLILYWIFRDKPLNRKELENLYRDAEERSKTFVDPIIKRMVEQAEKKEQEYNRKKRKRLRYKRRIYEV